MQAKLIINNKEFAIEVEDDALEKLERWEEAKNRTGYERVPSGEKYFYELDGRCEWGFDERDPFIDDAYESANYYSSEIVAQNNARADTLMRQLRRFAVENREEELSWKDKFQLKYCIYYDYSNDNLFVSHYNKHNHMGMIHFDSDRTALRAINTFRTELIWYFTEYKDSL